MKYWRKTLDRVKSGCYQVSIAKEKCKGCRFCIDFCPRQVLRESGELNARGYHPACADPQKECTGCGFCEIVCPEFAVSVRPSETGSAHE